MGAGVTGGWDDGRPEGAFFGVPRPASGPLILLFLPFFPGLARLRRVKRSSLLAVVAGILLACGLAYYFLVPRHSLPPDLLTVVPADAYGFVRLDVPSVLASDAYKRLVVERGEAEGVERIKKACGFNPLERLKELVVFARPAPGALLPRFAFVGRGDLPHGELVDCVKKFAGKGAADLKRVDYEGIPAVTSSGGGSRAAFVGRDGVVGGDADSVHAVLNAVVGKAEGMASDSVLRGLYREIQGGTDVAVVARMPDELRPLFLIFAARLPGGLSALTDVRALSANATLAQGKVAGGAVLVTSGPDKASAVVDAARAQVARFLAIPGVQLTPAGGVLRDIQMEARAERATFAGSIKVSTLEALLEILPALQQLSGALTEPAAPPAGPVAMGDAGAPSEPDAGAPEPKPEPRPTKKRPAPPAPP
jgi:hypothetical protein